MILTADPLRLSLEEFVSAHRGQKWIIAEARDMADLACHPAAILSDGSYSVFAKYSQAEDGWEQFETELAGLRLLSERSGVLTPSPLGILPAPGGCILVLETVPAVERTPLRWRQIGQALARLHQVKGKRFGLETDGYFGPLPQDNTPLDDWPTFYTELRLQPMLRRAFDSGNLPPEMVSQLERILARLPDLCGPPVEPVLLHGDAQQNNFISSESGAVVIDPAVYYGHPEMDLAYVDVFQPVPADVFEGYQQEMPVDPGFWERRSLWRLWGYLACVSVEGGWCLGRLNEALKDCLTIGNSPRMNADKKDFDR